MIARMALLEILPFCFFYVDYMLVIEFFYVDYMSMIDFYLDYRAMID